jgi:hypothetical protein
MIVGTYIDGRAVDYDETARAFSVGGTPVSPAQVRSYVAAGQLTWVSTEMGAWFDHWFPAAMQPIPSRNGANAVVIGVVIALLLLCGLTTCCGMFFATNADRSDTGAGGPGRTPVYALR